MNFAIIGAGGIAGTMAGTIKGMPEVTRYAIAARDLGRAQSFADKWGFEKAYGSYEELLADSQIDLVYIALPHSHHCEWTLKALEAGKNVLCEKAFAVNEKQAEKMIGLAEKKGLLLTEAIWTRYMPSRGIIDGLIKDGTIGDVISVSANLGYAISSHERIVRPELAGGALLDLTVYPLNFCSMVKGDKIKRIAASCVMTDTGVDASDTVMLEYEDGTMASMFTTIYGLTDRRGLITGTKGFLTVDNINNPASVTVWNPDRDSTKALRTIEVPEQITGYEYEVRSAMKAIAEGRTECPEMPHSETLEIQRQMDEIRRQFGIVYPGIE